MSASDLPSQVFAEVSTKGRLSGEANPEAQEAEATTKTAVRTH